MKLSNASLAWHAALWQVNEEGWCQCTEGTHRVPSYVDERSKEDESMMMSAAKGRRRPDPLSDPKNND